MPIGGQTIGRDISIHLSTPQGNLVLPPDFITSFEVKPAAKMIKYLPLTGIINPLVFHEGLDMEIEIARTSSALDDYWILNEAAYFNGVNLPASTIYYTIQEANLSISQYIITNVQFKLETLGMFKGNDYISQKLTAYGARISKLT